MSQTWNAAPPPEHPPFGAGDWLRIVVRGVVVGVVVFGGLAILLLLRLIERPIFGASRPVTPYITQGVCRTVIRVMGLGMSVTGPRMTGAGAIVANHASWLDIFVLNSRKNIYFVSKSEVAGWPGIGWLARATGTVFIRRDRRDAQSQTKVFEDRLINGHRLLFFPEGTSTDGLQVLSFKTTLFAAFFSDRLREDIQIQPVAVVYHAPRDADPRFYGWWGDMDFGPSLLQMLAQRRQGRVSLIYMDPLRVRDFENRKVLAKTLEDQVRAAHGRARLPGSGE